MYRFNLVVCSVPCIFIDCKTKQPGLRREAWDDVVERLQGHIVANSVSDHKDIPCNIGRAQRDLFSRAWQSRCVGGTNDLLQRATTGAGKH